MVTSITHHLGINLKVFNTAELEVVPRYVTGERINISNYKIPSLTTAVRHFVLFAKRIGRLPSTMPLFAKIF